MCLLRETTNECCVEACMSVQGIVDGFRKTAQARAAEIEKDSHKAELFPRQTYECIFKKRLFQSHQT